MEEISDLELVRGCLAGDRFYQRMLYDRFAKAMLRVCMQFTQDDYEAENILQESFIKVFEHMPDYQPSGTLNSWIRRIVVNSATDYYRRKKKMQYSEVDLQEAEEVSISVNLDQFSAKDILRAIQQLPDQGRMVFVLYAVEGYSHKEISEMLGITIGTSKSQFARQRMILQQRLSKYEPRESKGFLRHE